jgi:hypothetical protein
MLKRKSKNGDEDGDEETEFCNVVLGKYIVS